MRHFSVKLFIISFGAQELQSKVKPHSLVISFLLGFNYVSWYKLFLPRYLPGLVNMYKKTQHCDACSLISMARKKNIKKKGTIVVAGIIFLRLFLWLRRAVSAFSFEVCLAQHQWSKSNHYNTRYCYKQWVILTMDKILFQLCNVQKATEKSIFQFHLFFESFITKRPIQ